MSKTLFMETTEISPEKTISEIEAVLVRNGATAVMKEYANGTIEAVSFRVRVGQNEIPFRLPCRHQALRNAMVERRGRAIYSDKLEQAYTDKAKRVAWRQILRWIEAQMALVQTDMVKVEEVFFPYIQSKGGKTLYELQAGNLLGLPSGG